MGVMMKAASNAMRTLVLSGLMVCLGWSFHARAAELTVILPEHTDWSVDYQQWAAQHNHDVTLHPFIRLDALEAQLSEGLFEMPDTDRVAEADRRSQAHSSEITQAWRTAMLIHRFKLDQLPAIVINKDAVYYGLNPRKALDLYQRRTTP